MRKVHIYDANILLCFLYIVLLHYRQIFGPKIMDIVLFNILYYWVLNFCNELEIREGG